MKIMPCPLNGPRNIQEFICAGPVEPHPDPNRCSDHEWTEYVWMEENLAGVVREWWCHVATSYWFIAERNTVTDEILATYPASQVFTERVEFEPLEPPPEAAPAPAEAKPEPAKEAALPTEPPPEAPPPPAEPATDAPPEPEPPPEPAEAAPDAPEAPPAPADAAAEGEPAADEAPVEAASADDTPADDVAAADAPEDEATTAEEPAAASKDSSG